MKPRTDPEWREFEHLVGRLEHVLAPRGATIRSPDRIRDLVTGRKREVDAAIRYDNASGTVLIAVECRRRRYRQDDPWIEQLASKRQKVGATRLIAVSSKGFTPSAILSAEHFGIELRTFDEFTDDAVILALVPGLRLSVTVTDFALQTFWLIDAAGRAISFTELSQSLQDALSTEVLDAPLATCTSTGEVITARYLAWRAGSEDVPIGGPPVTKKATVKFAEGAWHTELASGRQELSMLFASFEFKRTEHDAPIQRVRDYTNLSQPLLRLVEGAAQVGPNDGIRMEVTVHPQPSNSTRPSMNATAASKLES